ncbi:MAG: SMP-30/gluconolactonase/LRE family protein [Candidatus Hydrogenedentes bacterium]|nr:SMP-30/gluconolactonase/LRE family protein [Candidatus Hydrogenedentota bacterium]
MASPIETLAEGFQFTEGPVCLPDGALVFSDIPADRIYRGDKTVFREPSGRSYGLTLDREGRLIAAEHGNRRVSRTEADGTIMAVAEKFEGKRLNSPNDVVVRSDGAIFFTDPAYGLEGGLKGPHSELGYCGVYAVSPNGDVRLLVKDFNSPNGLAFSPDEKILYVGDSEAGHVRAFDVAADGSLTNSRILYTVATPDGLKVDVQGNLWVTAEDGIHVVSPGGKLEEVLKFPTQPANCAFGGADGKTLFVTGRDKVYKVAVSVAGIYPASPHK